MEMDEISRVVNVIPILNPEAEPLPPVAYSVDILGRRIPVMFKQYISSAYLLRFLPLAFFDDYLFGIRFLHWFYFVLSISVFYLVVSKFSTYLASFGSLLVVTSPLFYPGVRISFADSLQILYLSLAAVFFERFFRRGEKKRDLFLAFFLLFLCANQMFYFAWVIAGLLITGVVFFPKEVARCFYPISRSLAVVGAALLGLLNFVIYNLFCGFPTAMVLINGVFRRDRYNAAPIDFRKALPFGDELQTKLQQLPLYFGEPRLYLGLYAAVLACTVLMGVYFWKNGRLRANRGYLLPAAATVTILALILITPNTLRAGHYIYLVPFLQLSVLSAVLGLGEGLKRFVRARKVVVIALPVLVTTISFTVSNEIVTATNRTGGEARFSPAIFDFVQYLRQRSIASGDILFTVWGLHLQPYFLNRGDFRFRQVVYELLARPTEAEKETYFESLFSSVQVLPEHGDALYLPVFAGVDADVKRALFGFLEQRRRAPVLEQVFRERDGSPAILLYRLDHVDEFVHEQCAPVRSAQPLEDLRITRFGPQTVEAGRSGGLPMWFIASGLTPSTKVVLEGLLLRTVNAPDHVTALVPARWIRSPGRVSLFLYDPGRGGRSPAVELQVE